MKPRTVTVNIFETVTDEQFEDILSIFRIVEGVCGAELVKDETPCEGQYAAHYIQEGEAPNIQYGYYGYQPTHSNLDTSNPPQNGSGVPNHKQAVTCPVCYGTGHVDAGFYHQTSGQWSSSGGTETCKSCNGKGYVVI
jgi:DnaJ-class molecular chaperone